MFCNLCINSEIRGLIDSRDEKIGKKIREAEIKKIPYMLIVGEKEAEDGTVSVRLHGKGDQGTQKVDDFISKVIEEIKSMVS